MKKLVKVFAVAIAIGFCSVLTSSAPVSISESDEICTEQSELIIDDEGIVCTIRDAKTGNLIGRCYLCNCAKFAEALKK